MKIKIIIGALIVVSFFANIALGFNVSSALNASKQKEKEIITLKKKIEKLNKDSVSIPSKVVAPNSLDEAEQVVKSFFETQYSYDRETYKSRFDKIKQYVNDSVYGQLTSAGPIDVPGINFENKINNLQIYLKNGETGEFNGFVLLKSTYKVDKVKNPAITQMFQVKVNKNNGRYKITELENIGIFSPMKQS